MEKKYKLFTSSKCAPCIRVKNHLNIGFKDWESHVEIIDVTEINREDWVKMKEKYSLRGTPTLFDTGINTILFDGYSPLNVDGFIKSISQSNQ